MPGYLVETIGFDWMENHNPRYVIARDLFFDKEDAEKFCQSIIVREKEEYDGQKYPQSVICEVNFHEDTRWVKKQAELEELECQQNDDYEVDYRTYPDEIRIEVIDIIDQEVYLYVADKFGGSNQPMSLREFENAFKIPIVKKGIILLVDKEKYK